MDRGIKMKYDFIEIGTSNFDTLIESATDTTVGLSIEPIKYYLDSLPNKPRVKKLNCAVSKNNQHETLSVYYVPEDIINANNMPQWLKGCNSVGSYHHLHHVNNITHLVKIDPVPCVPLGTIFEQNDVTELDYLKIDTEGTDCDILLHFFEFIKTKPASNYPKKILFESNELSVPVQVELVKNKFIGIGYRVTQAGLDTILEI
jgi:hypothetical protein